MSERETDANKPAAANHSVAAAQPLRHRATTVEYLRAIEPASTTRVEALADGIFAVTMTLLILDLKLAPLPSDISPAQYTHALFELWPKLIAFLCSFITLGRLWQLHRNMFHLLARCDQQLLFWNLLSLIFVCLLPFTTSLAGERPHYSLSAALYAGNLLVLNIVYRGMWHHASHGDRLLKSDVDPVIPRAINRTFNVYSALIAVALVLSYFNSVMSIGLIVLHQLVMFVGQPIFKGRQA